MSAAAKVARAAKAQRGPTVTVERNRDTFAAAKALAADGLMVVTGPPLVCWVTLGGTDHAIRDDGDLGMPGSPVCDAWLATQAREHSVSLVALDGYAVRHVCERASITSAKLGARLQRFADDSGADVLLLDETTPTPSPPAAPEPPQHGETVAGPFTVGHVFEVDRSAVSGMSHLLDRLGRDSTVVSAIQDRLVAQRYASALRTEHRTIGGVQEQPAADWLRDVVLACEPRLLLIEEQALDRCNVDLDALAKTYHVAVGVLPGPRDPGHVTPESLLKETTACH